MRPAMIQYTQKTRPCQAKSFDLADFFCISGLVQGRPTEGVLWTYAIPKEF